VNARQLKNTIARAEGSEVEFKRTTGELKEGLEAICGFLNAKGGRVLFGVDRKGAIVGQQVSEQTIHEITEAFRRFEPPAVIDIDRVKVKGGREVVVLSVRPNAEALPFTFDGRPFERVGNTTRKMSQARYEALLLERAHASRRWENMAAYRVTLKDLDHEEILRTREAAIGQRRISAGTSMNVEDILDRLGLRIDGEITQAAQVLYGTRFLPDYPQCHLKMGRFRGTKITGDILDNKQEYLHAFAALREGMAFLDRTLPLAARFTEGHIFREDRLPVPPDALREILLNAIIHRDYIEPSGYVAIAVFDDRIEIRSSGLPPMDVTLESLSGPHLSKLRNPLVAETFHRTGAVEVWGRGTNRVIDECIRWGIEPPTFSELTGFTVVTFRAAVRPEGTKSAPSRHQVGTKSALSFEESEILRYCGEAKALTAVMEVVGRKDRTKFRDQFIRPLIEAGLLEMTIPGKPNSRLQQYRLTAAGRQWLEQAEQEGKG
jgi:ATP-dependent DNA helicase RecG